MTDENSNLIKYEKVVKRTIRFLKNSDSIDWRFVPCDTDDKELNRIRLHEAQSDDSKYLLKADGILNCAADRVLLLNRDNSYVTRCQWDNADLAGIRQCESFRTQKLKGEIRIVQSIIGVPSWTKWVGMQDRDFLGVQFDFYDASTRSHILVFQTVDHPRYKVPSGRVKAEGSTILRIEERDPNQCYVSVIAHVKPGGWIPAAAVSFYKNRMRERLLLYEKVARNDYHIIYNNWPCSSCHMEQEATEPTCRTCQHIDNPALLRDGGIYGDKVKEAERLFMN